MLIDDAISEDRNVIKKEAEILKYKDIITEIQCKWNVKAIVIPVITGATRTIRKSFRQYLSNIPGSMKSRNYKNSHIGHADVLRKVLHI